MRFTMTAVRVTSFLSRSSNRLGGFEVNWGVNFIRLMLVIVFLREVLWNMHEIFTVTIFELHHRFLNLSKSLLKSLPLLLVREFVSESLILVVACEIHLFFFKVFF